MIAELPDGTELEFPDETSPFVIQRTVKNYLSKISQTEQPNFVEKVGNIINPQTVSTAIQSSLTSPSFLPSIGATIGSFATPMFPPAGAALGGAAGKAVQLGFKSAFNPSEATSPSKVLGEVATSGAVQGLISGTIGTIAAGLKMPIIAVKKLLPSITRVTAGIPEKTMEIFLKEGDEIVNAPSLKTAGQMYKSVVEKMGLSGGFEALQKVIDKAIIPDTQAVPILNSVASKLKDGTITPQEVIAGRQVANRYLKNLSQEKGQIRAAVVEIKTALDDILGTGQATYKETVTNLPEAMNPEFLKVSKLYRNAAIKEEFESILPKNKNLSPNVLRSLGMIGLITKGISEGRPGLIAMAAAGSPKLVETGVRASQTAGEFARPISQFTGGLVAADYPFSKESLIENFFNPQK